MVKIINGEVVQDDDPRLQSNHPRTVSHQPSQGNSRQFAAGRASPAAASGANAQRAAFDWSAPPFKLSPSQDGRLPDVEVFGVAVPAIGLIGVAAAGLFLGWRGLLAGAIIGYLYLTNKPAAGTTGRQQAAAAAGGSSFMQQLQQSSGAGGTYGDSGGLPQRHTQSNSRWANAGKGHKLGSELPVVRGWVVASPTQKGSTP